MQWSAYVLDAFVAPKLSALKVCSAPDVPELPNYLGSLQLNQMLGVGKYPEPLGVLLANFTSRLSTAITDYRTGRDHLLNYVGALPQQKLAEHRKAVSSFESCILRAHIAVTCLNGVAKLLPGAPLMYKQRDGSDYDRLRILNNRIKHFDEDVEDAARKAVQGIPLAPIWITDTGLESTAAAVQFTELADILTNQSADAKAFAEDFFREAAERRKQQQAGNGTPEEANTGMGNDDAQAPKGLE